MNMEEPREPELHPFDQFKETMRKLVTVSKADLDAKLKEHQATKPERKAGRKPKSKEVVD
jgi:hypothetical protein